LVLGGTMHRPTAQRFEVIACGWNSGLPDRENGRPVSFSVALRPVNQFPGGYGAEIEIRIDGRSVDTISNMREPKSLTSADFSTGSRSYRIRGSYYGYDRFGRFGVLGPATCKCTIDIQPNAAFLATGQLYLTPQGYVMMAHLIRVQ